MSPGKKMEPFGFSDKGEFAIIIPVYNHAQTIQGVVEQSLKLNLPVFVVNDGSTDSTGDTIRHLQGIDILHHHKNRGKGAAILTGFAEASKIADWAITLDADGQHHPKDAIELIQAIPENERPIVVGMRNNLVGRDIPWTSRFGRKFSNFWVWVSGGPRIRDSQSGFRIYPLPDAMHLNVTAKRYQFEVEILVKAGWENIPVIEAPIAVDYAKGRDRISHFRPFIDFLRNSGTFTRLILMRMLIPRSIRQKPRGSMKKIGSPCFLVTRPFGKARKLKGPGQCIESWRKFRIRFMRKNDDS